MISRAGHRTGEHEGGDSLQLPGLELSVKIIIIVLRRSTIIDFCHHDNVKGFVNKNEEENSISTVKTEIEELRKSKKNITNDNKKFIQKIYGEGFKKI